MKIHVRIRLIAGTFAAGAFSYITALELSDFSIAACRDDRLACLQTTHISVQPPIADDVDGFFLNMIGMPTGKCDGVNPASCHGRKPQRNLYLTGQQRAQN